MADFEIVPYSSEQHAALVFDSFGATLYGKKGSPGCWPWNIAPGGRWETRQDFSRRLSRGRAAVAVYRTEHGPVIAGWAAVSHGEVLFAFVKEAYRLGGIATSLLARLGCDFSKPVGVRYWTPAAALISQRDAWQLHPVTE